MTPEGPLDTEKQVEAVDLYVFRIAFTATLLPRLVKLYNSVQMFEPFWDRNQLFFGMISLSKFFIQDFRKQIGSVGLGPNHSGNIFWGKIWIFVEVIFFDPTDRETIPSQTSDMGKKTVSVLAHTFSQP